MVILSMFIKLPGPDSGLWVCLIVPEKLSLLYLRSSRNWASARVDRLSKKVITSIEYFMEKQFWLYNKTKQSGLNYKQTM